MVIGLGDCRKIRPKRARDEPTWSLPEGLAAVTVRGPDHASPIRGNSTMSTDHSLGAGRKVYKALPIAQ